MPPALAAASLPRLAHAEPTPGRPFPTCTGVDLNDRHHSHQELRGRRTFVTVITDQAASDQMAHWLNNAESRYQRGGPIVAIVSLQLSFIAWDGIVRSQARAHTPRWRWGYVWLDRDGAMARQLGLPINNRQPWAYVVDQGGNVVASHHGIASDPQAQGLWSAMSAP